MVEVNADCKENMVSSTTLDMVIARLLFVRPAEADAEATTRVANRVIGGSLVFSAVRCTIQYVLLPIVLPLLGMAATIPPAALALLDVAVICSLIYTLRRLWQARHPRRWDYLALAVMSILGMVAFLAYDLVGG
jgi:hypothetical protein